MDVVLFAYNHHLLLLTCISEIKRLKAILNERPRQGKALQFNSAKQIESVCLNAEKVRLGFDRGGDRFRPRWSRDGYGNRGCR